MTPAVGTTPPTPPKDGDTPGGGDNPPPTDTPTNTVVSKFGKIRIDKVGSDDATKPLVATFEIYRAVVTGTSPDFKYSCSRDALMADIDPNTAGVQTQPSLGTITTNSTDGTGVSGWLGLSTWYNDGVEQSATGNNDGYLDGAQYATKYGYRNYCLVETVAPGGYQLLAEPVLFSLTQEGDVVNPTTPYTFTQIVNQPDNFNNGLPLTGGQGIALLSVGGLALIGGGLGWYAWRRVAATPPDLIRLEPPPEGAGVLAPPHWGKELRCYITQRMQATPATSRPRRWPHRVVVSFLLISGAVVTGWPVTETIHNDRQTTTETAEYVMAIEAKKATASQPMAAALSAAHAYNDTLTPSLLSDPWGGAEAGTTAAHDHYLATLNDDGVMGRLRIPAIQVDMLIRHDTTKASLDQGVGRCCSGK